MNLPAANLHDSPPITTDALLPGLAVCTSTCAGMVARATGSGPNLLLLHGGTGSWTHWIRNIEALSRSFRVIVPDLPGMGESLDVPVNSDLDSYGAHLLAAVEAGLLPSDEPFFIAGFSFGAVVTAWLAARLPQRVLRIALLGPGGFPPGTWVRPPLRSVSSDATDDEINAVHRRNLELMMVGDPCRIDALTVAMQRRNHSLTRFRSRFLGYRDSLGPSLRATRCPVLAILGQDDPLPISGALARAAYLKSNSPRLSCRILADASHWVAFEQAEEVNRLLLGFFMAQGEDMAGSITR
ncbi:alpha/beta fold hydrolase [Piscinibacter sakaiensis]|uniref:alpha/beta fold hydrolase n=1 Tax=Piscinibacter sakaiensis TaxID=1547922 RepID=UPI003AAF2DD8